MLVLSTESSVWIVFRILSPWDDEDQEKGGSIGSAYHRCEKAESEIGEEF